MPPLPAAEIVGAIFTPATRESPAVFVEPLVKVKLSKLPVPKTAGAKELLAKVLILPVVVVDVILVVPKPVSATAPEVPVKLRAPVVNVKPFEAVSRAAEVIVPEEVVEILPVVVILSPAVAGCTVVPERDQYPTVPVDAPVILPVQVKLPVVPASAMVQRVLVPSLNSW